MLPAVFSPTSATLPATRTAAVSGSGEGDAGDAAACGRSRGGAVAADLRGVFGFGFGFGLAAARARVVGFARVEADAREALARFSLRCPGRDLGRLPSTPG
jgi:hypothetical protein